MPFWIMYERAERLTGPSRSLHTALMKPAALSFASFPTTSSYASSVCIKCAQTSIACKHKASGASARGFGPEPSNRSAHPTPPFCLDEPPRPSLLSGTQDDRKIPVPYPNAIHLSESEHHAGFIPNSPTPSDLARGSTPQRRLRGSNSGRKEPCQTAG